VVVCDHVAGVVSAPPGPYYGPLAHGFACGAHLAVHVSGPWNALGDPVRDHERDRGSLADGWGVETAEDWSRQVGYLFAGLNVGTEVDAVLDVRRTLLRGQGHFDLPVWQDAVAAWARRRRAPAEVGALVETAAAVTRIESRFRTDGLLPPEGIVTSAFGYDFGRAVTMARWGHGARFCDRQAAERIVLRAGELCRRHYTSWADFSAGYALGRVVRLGEERYDHRYASVLGAHRLLVSDRTSPWWHLPFA
jgi:hypothetical protein